MTDAFSVPTLSELSERSGLSYRALARRFSIPYRTMEDWSSGRRQPPDYVLLMMQELLNIA